MYSIKESSYELCVILLFGVGNLVEFVLETTASNFPTVVRVAVRTVLSIVPAIHIAESSS